MQRIVSTGFPHLRDRRGDLLQPVADGQMLCHRDAVGLQLFARIGVLGMFRSVRSEEFRQAVEQVVQTGEMISSALGYQKK